MYQSYFKLELFALAKGLFIGDPSERGTATIGRKNLKYFHSTLDFGNILNFLRATNK
jgi:hypothetical protein